MEKDENVTEQADDITETETAPSDAETTTADAETAPSWTGKKRKREKKKHPVLKIILGVLATLIIVSGGFTLLSKITGKVLCWDKGRHRFCIIDVNERLVLEKTKLDDFDSVELKVSGASVHFIPSDGYYIEFDVLADVRNPYSVNNGQLVYKDNTYVHFGFSLHTKNEYINIYYPEGADISKLNANLDMGSMTIDGAALGNADIDLDMGSLEITGSAIAKISVDLDMGSLTVQDCSIGDADIDLDMGGMTIVDTSISDGLDADLDMGSATLRLNAFDANEAPVDYGFHLDTDLGKITVNGEKQGNKYSSQGASEIKVSCDMGGITVEAGNR